MLIRDVASMSRRRRNPALGLPFRKRKSGFNLEEVDAYVGPFRAKFSQGGGLNKPFGGELQVAVIQILAFEGAQCENLTRREGRFEVGGKVRTRLFLQCV
jgi:hypothetical protein